ncbi:MAG: hypothetical protein ABWY00_18910 [Dongiaceae bacterium]
MTDRSGTSFGRAFKNAAAIGLLTATLAGCSSNSKGPPKPCPMVDVPQELTYMTSFDNAGTDLSDIAYEVQIDKRAMRSFCYYSEDGDPNYIRTDLKIQFLAARGPKFTGDKAHFKYFVAVTGPGGSNLKKDIFDADVDLSGDKLRNITVDEIDPIKIFPKAKENGDFYRIYVGLDLTKDQLDYNKRNPR